MFRTLLFSLISSAAFLAAAPQPQSFRRPLVFEPNRGQAPAQVTWIGRGSNYQLMLTNEGVTMVMQEGAAEPRRRDAAASAKPKRSAVQMKLTGSQPWSKVTGLEPTGGMSNYFLGNDPKAWFTDIPHYAKVSAAGVYDGIDLIFYTNGANLEYDFIVAPGANAGQIQLTFDGMERMQVDNQSGDLVLTTTSGSEVRQVRPKVYQQIGNERVEVRGGYRLLDRARAAFTLAPYDHNRPLLIDPTVSFTTLLGGSSYDVASSIAVDSAGNAYVAGSTDSTNFPVNDSSLQWDQPSTDAFVTKLSPQGAILFSTYLGGNDYDTASGIAVDSTGVYITGDTLSTNFPHQNSKRNNSQDIFVTKVFLDGNGITYTAIVGDSDKNDGGRAIAVVPSTHEAYVTGFTNFPAAPPHPTNVRIARLDAAGHVLRSIFIRASGSDEGDAIAVDHSGDVWVTGVTCSPDFPITLGTPFPGTQPGTCTGFATKWDAGLNGMKLSRFWGTGSGIAIDAGNNAYVAGTVRAPFAALPGAFQSVPPQSTAAFITKFNPAGTALNSTYLGGNTGFSNGQAIALNASGEVYVAGLTAATDFPGVPTIPTNFTTGFLCKFAPDLSVLRYSKFMGIQLSGVALFDAAPPFSISQAYATGDVYSGPTVPTAQDAFVVKFDDNIDRYQVLWHNPATGDLSSWLFDGQGGVAGIHPLSVRCGALDGCSKNQRVIGTIDLNQDGVGDVLWYNPTTGDVQAWLLNSAGIVTGTQSLSRQCGASDGCSKIWTPVGVGDFNHDGTQDLLWHNELTGELQAWLLSGSAVKTTLTLSKRCAVSDGCWTTWRIVGIGDFNHDGIDDLFWHNATTGSVQVSLMNGSGVVMATQALATRCGTSDGCSVKMKAVGIADVNKDGVGDLLWDIPANGQLSAWLLNGTDRLLGTLPISQLCDAASGCQGSQLVGILRDYHVAP